MITIRAKSVLSLFLALALLVSTPSVNLFAQNEKPAAAQKEPPPPTSKDGMRLLTAMDTLRINTVGGPALSPDGKWVAYTVAEAKLDADKEWTRTTHVWLVPVSGGDARQFTRGEKSCTAPAFSPDGKSLAFLTDREKPGERQVWSLSLSGGEAQQVTTHKGGVTAFDFSPDGKSLLLSAQDQPSKDEEARTKVHDDAKFYDSDLRMTHLWLWNLDKKEATRLTDGNFTTSEPRFSPDATRITFTSRPTPRADDGGLSDVWLLTLASKEKHKLLENPGPDSGARWSPDGATIAFDSSPDTTGGVAPSYLYVIPAAGGTPRNISPDFDLDPGAPNWSPDGKQIFFAANIRQAVEIFSADPASTKVRQLTTNGNVLSIADISSDGKTLIGTLSGPRRPAEIYAANSSFTSFNAITNTNHWLSAYALAETEVLKWKSADGLEIEGLLTKPIGFDPTKKYPLLLNPHGGPTGASLNSFNATVQVLAANGNAILQPNFRGSTGRGVKFAAANKNTWGKGDYEDCMTGVDAVLAKNIADPDRLGAFGWSYGGYMTFWILTQTDRFKAVSPGAGLTNIYSMYSQNDIQRYLRWFYADKSPWDAQELYWDRSPMKYVKNVKTPTLILHGERDTRVPIAQAQEFYRALVERNVPVEFVVYPRAGHGITEPRHQLDRIRRYVAFFAKYLNNPSATEPAPGAAAKLAATED